MARAPWAALCVLAAALGGASAHGSFPARYHCALCYTLAVIGHEHCDHFDGGCDVLAQCGACEATVSRAMEGRRGGSRVRPSAGSVPVQRVQLRVSKAMGTKPYGTLRISAITSSDAHSPLNASAYSAPFKYRWTGYALHSSVQAVTPGKRTPLRLNGLASGGRGGGGGAGGAARGRSRSGFPEIWLPAQGAGVRGVLIADPCVRAAASSIGLISCAFGDLFGTVIMIAAIMITISHKLGGAHENTWTLPGVGDAHAGVAQRLHGPR